MKYIALLFVSLVWAYASFGATLSENDSAFRSKALHHLKPPVDEEGLVLWKHLIEIGTRTQDREIIQDLFALDKKKKNNPDLASHYVDLMQYFFELHPSLFIRETNAAFKGRQKEIVAMLINEGDMDGITRVERALVPIKKESPDYPAAMDFLKAVRSAQREIEREN